MTRSSHDAEALAAFIREALGAEWTVEVEARADMETAQVLLEHPLAGQVYHVMHARDGGFVDQMRSRLQAPEFRVVRDRPQAMPHMELLGHLRTFAAGHGLLERSLETLGGVLHEDGVLSAEEAAWLAWAGLPWSTEELPAPTFAEFLDEIAEG